MKKLLLLVSSCLFLIFCGACATSSSSYQTVRINLDSTATYDTYFTKAFNQPPEVCYDAVIRVYGKANAEDVLDTSRRNVLKITTERFNPLLKTLGVRSVFGRETELQYFFTIYGDENSCVLRADNIRIWINGAEQREYDYMVSDKDWADTYAQEMEQMNRENGRESVPAQVIPLTSITYSYHD